MTKILSGYNNATFRWSIACYKIYISWSRVVKNLIEFLSSCFQKKLDKNSKETHRVT